MITSDALREKGAGVYKLVDPDGRCYVGSSNNIKRRWNEHRSDARNGRHHSACFQAAWDRFGESGIRFVVLENCPEEFLVLREQQWIDQLSPELNTSPFAVPRRLNSRKGIPLSAEHRRKISEGRKGIRIAPEHRAAIAATLRGRRPSNYGKPFSAEVRAKISAARKAQEAARLRTHCGHGHEFTPENTYVRPDTGVRTCLACRKAAGKRMNDRKREARRAARATGQADV